MRWLDRIDRAALIARGVALGFDEAQLNLWLDRVLQARRSLRTEQVAAIVAQLQTLIDALTSQRTRALAGRAFIVSDAPAGPAKVATLAVLDDGIALLAKRIAALTAERDSAQ